MRRMERDVQLLIVGLLALLASATQGADGSEGEKKRDACRDHAVLDDYRRSPLYQPETPRDVLCDRDLVKGWYRFTVQNRSAEIPTKCASVNYCGTQAPIWLKLSENQVLPNKYGEEIEAVACVSWMSLDSDVSEDSEITEDGETLRHIDCCAMQYPVTVRSCSDYVIYKLIPTEACNMAYCSHPASFKDDEKFEFEKPPSIEALVVESSNQRQNSNQDVYLNCSIELSNEMSEMNRNIRFRFRWLKKSKTVRTALVDQAIHFDLLNRNEIAAGDKVVCQVEAVVLDDFTLPGGRRSTRTIATSTSSPFIAGIAVYPSNDYVTAFKNGSHVVISLKRTMPFVCAPHLSAKDCHLSVQIVQQVDESEFGEKNRQNLAIAPCHLSFFGFGDAQSFVLAPISDYVMLRKNVTRLQLLVTSYGDAWWHGFQLQNVTIHVKDLAPVQCYAFTQGHVIGISDSLDRVTQPGRHLLYNNPLHSFEVWVEYQSCSGRKDALCICSVEIRSFGALSSGETFRLERCHRKKQTRAGDSKWSLPRMSLVGLNPKRRHFRVLESRQGKMITVVLEHGAKVRIRTEDWGMSVSLVDLGQEHEDLIETVSGLCNPGNHLEQEKSKKKKAYMTSERHLPDEFCTCSPSQDAFLSSVQVHNLPKCDPELEDCPSACQEPQKTVEWTTFFNYLDITDQVRLDVGDVDSPHSNLIDQPQRDSASIENDPYEQFFPSFNWESVPTSFTSGTNLGRDIYWTTAHGRRRRDASFKTFTASSEYEDVSLYCSNLLVNSTVALECGQYLVGSFILKAINICIDDVSRNEDLSWAPEALGLLEDQCEVEASYQRTSDWSRDLLGHQAVSPAIVEALNCPNRCSYQGVCLSFGCVCQPGFSGSDCSLMDDNPPRIERINNGEGLCDVLSADCSKIEITGSGFIDSSSISCQVHPGKFDGSNWHRGGIGNADRLLPTSAEFVNHEKMICHLLRPKRLLDDVSDELHVEIKVSNDGQRFSSPDRLTIYHSGCRICPKTRDNWPVCSDRDDVCYLDNTCFSDGQINPKNHCEKCDADRPLSWSFNSANTRPIVIGSLKTSVYDGQLLEKVISVIDDDPDIRFKLMDPLTDAKITADGVFRWTAVSNALTSNQEVFAIQISDDCHPPIDVKLQVEVLPCPCLNGGTCKNEAMNDTTLLSSNRIHEKRLHYRCECRPGFTGSDCSSRIDFCDPNPCKHGLCLSAGDGFVCRCFNGHRGIICDKEDFNLFSEKSEKNETISGCRCLNGGSCLGEEGKGKCSCPAGFAGRQCQWPSAPCPGACRNGGHCSRRGACICKKGWTGSQCQTAVCEPSCVNGGRCSSPGKCTCPIQFRGSRCQKPICKPKCLNGGRCIAPNVCQCPDGLAGPHCQSKITSTHSVSNLLTNTATLKKRKSRKRTKSSFKLAVSHQ